MMRHPFAYACALLIGAGLLVAPAASAITGELEFIDGIRDGEAGALFLDQANGIDVSPDGRNVYVSAQIDDAVTAFRRNPVTGKLKFVDVERDGLGGVTLMNGPRDVVVSPDGLNVYVTATIDNGLVEFDRNPQTGALSVSEQEVDGAGGIAYMDSPEQVVVSPTGSHVYVTSLTEDGVVWFDRDPDPDTGFLAVSGQLQDNDFHNGASGIAIDPQGKTVIVGGFQGNEVTSYGRASNSGALTFKDTLVDGLFAEGLASPRGVQFSPDGTEVYVASVGDDAITRLAHNVADHTINYIEDLREDEDNVFAITNPFGLEVVNSSVYLASNAGGPGAGAVAAFKPSPIDGVLSQFEIELDDEPPTNTLGVSMDVAASPDGHHLYSTAGTIGGNTDDDAVNAFVRDLPLKLTAKARKRQKAKKLRVKVKCSAPCRVSAKARGKATKKFKSKNARKALAGDKRKTIRVRFSNKAFAAIEDGSKAKVTVRATDAFNNVRLEKVRVKLRT